MSIRSLVRKATRRDKAVYWAPGPIDPYSKPSYSVGVEIKVRWVDEVVTFTDQNGQLQVSKAKVLIEPDFVILPKGVLWHGALADVVDINVPTNNPGALEIRGLDSIPDMKNSIKVTTAYL